MRHGALLFISDLRGPGGGGARPGRFRADSLFPALLFGTLALASCSGVLRPARRGPADPSLHALVAYALDVAHPLLTGVFCGLVAVLFLARGAPRGSRARPTDLAVPMLGTFGMGAIALQPPTTADWRVLALADSLLVGGLTFSIYAAASLGRCFGLAPEARGLVTSGAYRLVRHPLYLGELVAALGALLPVLAPPATLIFSLFCLCQAARAVLEERALTAAFPEYAEYRRRTPALVPWPRPGSHPGGSRANPASPGSGRAPGAAPRACSARVRRSQARDVGSSVRPGRVG